MLDDSLYADFTLFFKARSDEDFGSNSWVDLAIVFAHLDDTDYNYALVNSNSGEAGDAVVLLRPVRKRSQVVTLSSGMVAIPVQGRHLLASVCAGYRRADIRSPSACCC